jgi:hypothetical protein
MAKKASDRAAIVRPTNNCIHLSILPSVLPTLSSSLGSALLQKASIYVETPLS